MMLSEHRHFREYVANVIGEHISTRTDDYGNITMTSQDIPNHRKFKTACELKDRCTCVNNQKKLLKSAKGWDIESLWQN